MRVMRSSLPAGGSLALATLYALLAASVAAAEDYGTRAPAIPAGQERLIGTMLGRGTLVGDCKFSAGGVDYTVIRATYRCPRGQVALELTHLQDGTADSIQTGQFAVTLQSGSPPSGFQEALLARIRSGEAGFSWTWPEIAPLDDGTGGDATE